MFSKSQLIFFFAFLICNAHAWFAPVEKIDGQVLCTLCEDTLTILKKIIPTVNDVQAQEFKTFADEGCKSGRVQQVGLTDVCNRAVSDVLEPLLQQLVKDNGFVPETDCHLIAFCR
ncbi:hypothetical protein M3Y98_00228500 [Aphelenchoides besseyi]|nr:hypothetical protein M3Y98_00228500 [Aphelenchoides besseyi]KAI6200564.1 hypothetical protein M3Y96_00747400 [Aphelenchoides besseyi]